LVLGAFYGNLMSLDVLLRLLVDLIFSSGFLSRGFDV